jgi:hypothetical protein
MTAPVRKTIPVAAPQEIAFGVFTDGMTTWWPLDTHHVGRTAAVAAIVEPRAGGRWLERDVDGSEKRWGHVLVWEPPHRVVLSSELGADWRPDPRIKTEIEVRFFSEGARSTRVELEHRKLEAYGAFAEELRAVFDAPDGGWARLLERYARAAAR